MLQTETLGDRICKAREAQGTTQKQLARRVGVSLTTISKLEHDRIDPRVQTVQGLASALGCTVVYLLYGKRGLKDRLLDRWPESVLEGNPYLLPIGGFEFIMPHNKAWQDGEGALRFEGIAASTSLDRQAERLTPEAIEKMQQYNGLDLLPTHKGIEALGTVEKCWVDNNQFRVAGMLDAGNPEAARLYEKLKAGKQYGLSIGGRVLKAHWAFDASAGGQVKFIDDVKLDHISVCRPTQAANPDTYLSVLGRAADSVIGEQPEEADDGQDAD